MVNNSIQQIPEKKIFYDSGQSWLNANRIYLNENLYINIPTVREILDHEQFYLGLVTALTSTPYQYMAQLDDMGIDYETLSDYQFFSLMFILNSTNDLSLVFGDLKTQGYSIIPNDFNNTTVLFNPELGNDYIIDELLYANIAKTIRKINNIEEVHCKAGNAEAKAYLLKKEKRKLRRNANKPYNKYFEKMVIALVNRPEFKYNYEDVMDLSIYKFNQSVQQIRTSITFDNTMIGVYAGTVDPTKMVDKSSLSWIQN
ncbi:Uncharacterised protein [uncultured Coprococcus sp.]|uniref:hypothetical protein n=1 Tax=Coprococcus ammoniilyticus TaxID=2981785 RepID=UPI000822B3FF|nr:hypothetical protein [Coprococcus ammoniilyticus]MCU6731117.1 hypothetical protein [Coprococcus ammoniilyticus]SCH94622.1 Uncharacterised protein [uncultured Coprococcus sp.]